MTDLIGDGHRISTEEMHAAGDIQPALVDAEGLHQVGVLPVDGVDPPGILAVKMVMGRQQNQGGALLLGLPDGLGGLDAVFLGVLVLGQDDAVAGGGIAADGHRQIQQLRMAQQLHRGEKAVQITVQDHPFHGITSNRSFVLLYHGRGTA